MATSKLQRLFGDMLDSKFPQYKIRENYRPDWLISPSGNKLELDFFIENINIAYEIQGEQHFRYIEFFHGNEDGFRKRLLLDQEKKDLCYGRNIKLVEICTETDAILAIKELEKLIIESEHKTGYFYQNPDYSKSSVHRTKRKMPRARKNSEEERIKRLQECKEKLELYESGKIQREPNVVKMWRDVIANNGESKRS